MTESTTSDGFAVDLGGRTRAELLIGGFGGQGVILAGFVLGSAAAVHAGRNAVMAQSYGPESRGGACMCEVVIADGEIPFPRVTHADVLVVMSQEAYKTYAPRRPNDCLLIVDDDLVVIDENRERGRQVLRAPATRLAEEMGRRIIANIVMLGFLSGSTGVVPIDVMQRAVAASVPKGTEELNARAVDAGYECARNLVAGPVEAGRQ